MEINEIYQETDKIVLKHIMFSDEAMKYSQSFGYNGFKRMFRVLNKEFIVKHIELENKMFDYYRTILNVTPESVDFKPLNLKNILETYNQILKSDIETLGNYNKEHINKVGMSNCTIKDIIHCLNHKYEKTSRWIARFNESNWNVIDIHYLDDNLHKKYKEIEGG